MRQPEVIEPLESLLEEEVFCLLPAQGRDIRRGFQTNWVFAVAQCIGE
ncbi:hypothetical protein [Photorhabdus heterorhabditis]|nr:hypothetical protein [Photorhabdus heterorhabditis]